VGAGGGRVSGRRRILRLAAALFALASTLAVAADALAHAINLSVVFIRIDGTNVQANLTVTGTDVDRAAGVKITDPNNGLVDPRRLAEAELRLRAYLAGRTTITARGVACDPTQPLQISAESDGGIAVEMRFDCPTAEAIVYRSRALVDFDPAAKQLVQLWRTDQYVEAGLLEAGKHEIELTGSLPGPLAVFVRYAVLGIEHIFRGYDHVCFLVAVLLWARRMVTLVKIVTAFTLAHSITLTLAALEVVRLPSAVVEAAIAASIVFVAVENFFAPDIEKRWRWTFGFGLIHGFGFAGVLGELGLPKHAVVTALAAFNIGVEIGQLAIVAILLAVLLVADRALASDGPAVRRPALVYAGSSLIALFGAWWLAERVWA
jgi:hypothetical protein